ncbi:MAG: DUF5103 domain-containing protein [Muribaculaceae bacterium]|nr:DUF5103 domain-containing protein [Muribaculaceae bacterium]
MGPPVIRLGSNEKLNINFDIIGEDSEYLRFRLIHCNSDWQPSRLMENEYLGNFNDATIDDYAYSNNTYVHYVNYNIEIPSPQLPILRSGNYLLQVYPEHDPDEIILQARFAVSEGITPVNAGLTTRTDKGFNSEFQQLFFNADLSALPNVNPYQDLIITITQNNRPETVRVLKHPMRVTDKKAVFEHSPELIFEAGNEYRRFETVRTDYPGMHIDKVDFQNGMWNAWLQQDSSRKHRQYVYDNTQHGRFKIDDYNSTDPDLGADYVLVHFSLDPGERQYGEIYLDGDFTNHTYTESNLMRYDWNDGLYHASIPLKQGSYNYQYVVKTDKEKVPLPASIEGNKYETNNEYLIQVFLRTPGSRADRLIGSTLLSNL